MMMMMQSSLSVKTNVAIVWAAAQHASYTQNIDPQRLIFSSPSVQIKCHHHNYRNQKSTASIQSNPIYCIRHSFRLHIVFILCVLNSIPFHLMSFDFHSLFALIKRCTFHNETKQTLNAPHINIIWINLTKKKIFILFSIFFSIKCVSTYTPTQTPQIKTKSRRFAQRLGAKGNILFCSVTFI